MTRLIGTKRGVLSVIQTGEPERKAGLLKKITSPGLRYYVWESEGKPDGDVCHVHQRLSRLPVPARTICHIHKAKVPNWWPQCI